MLYHASFYAGYVLGGDTGWAGMFDGRFGLVGVSVFFAISGMLMADLVQRSDPWRFLGHRMVRIYPAYLAAVAVTLPITAWVGGYKPSLHLFSLLLVPAGQRIYYLGTEWTLVFECSYYVALFVIAAMRWHRHLNVIAAVWLAVIFAAPLVVGWDDRVFGQFYSLWFAPANAAFAGGLLIPWIARRVRIPLGAGVVATAMLMAALPGDPVVNRLAAGAAAMLLVLDAVRFKAPRSAVSGFYILGEWSYALYLLHVPVLLTVYRLWPAPAGAGAAFVCAVGASLILSAGFGMLDVAVYRRLRRAADDLSEDVLRRRVNLYVGAFIVASVIAVVV
jgi:peptidoglycan/LPS O-acetylase OafA/YrhL